MFPSPSPLLGLAKSQSNFKSQLNLPQTHKATWSLMSSLHVKCASKTSEGYIQLSAPGKGQFLEGRCCGLQPTAFHIQALSEDLMLCQCHYKPCLWSTGPHRLADSWPCKRLWIRTHYLNLPCFTQHIFTDLTCARCDAKWQRWPQRALALKGLGLEEKEL
jgi:hypothetical protein